MGCIYKKCLTRPLPAHAEIVAHQGEWVARWQIARGERRTAKVITGCDGTRRISSRAKAYTARYRDAQGQMRDVPTGCRDKAAAVCLGMAELGMCVPYMRQRAESLANVVIDSAPNAIVVVDAALVVQDVSRRAEGMFRCHKPQAVGQPLSDFIPISTFEEVRDRREPVLGRRLRYRDDLVVAESVVPVEGSKLIVGIIQDVTFDEEQQAEMKCLRESAISQAQEVINKQMRVAHEIASLLGETTAETKVQLSRLINLMQEDDGAANR